MRSALGDLQTMMGYSHIALVIGASIVINLVAQLIYLEKLSDEDAPAIPRVRKIVLAVVFALPVTLCVVTGQTTATILLMMCLASLATLDFTTSYVPKQMVVSFAIGCIAYFAFSSEVHYLSNTLLFGCFAAIAWLTKRAYAKRGLVPMGAGDVYLLGGLSFILPVDYHLLGFVVHMAVYGIALAWLKPRWLYGGGGRCMVGDQAVAGRAAGVPLVPAICLSAIQTLSYPDTLITSIMIETLTTI